jgi:hypothetical protein
LANADGLMEERTLAGGGTDDLRSNAQLLMENMLFTNDPFFRTER